MVQLEWMEITILLLFFLAGMIFNYKAGKDYGGQDGVDSTLEYLEKQKIITIDEDGDFKPYNEEGEQ
jgi:hypothetical protein